jgi:hypothetical protein
VPSSHPLPPAQLPSPPLHDMTTPAAFPGRTSQPPQPTHRPEPAKAPQAQASSPGSPGVPGRSYRCKACGREYASTDAVRKHARQNHFEWLREFGKHSPLLYCTPIDNADKAARCRQAPKPLTAPLSFTPRGTGARPVLRTTESIEAEQARAEGQAPPQAGLEGAMERVPKPPPAPRDRPGASAEDDEPSAGRPPE